MTCATIKPRLDEWRDGSLDPASASLVSTHLDTCVACREELAFLVRMRADVAALPATVDPPVDLWPGIEAAVARQRSRRLVPWLVAAAILLVAAAGVLASQLNRTAADPAPDAVIALESDYRAAAAELQRAVEARRVALGPTVSSIVAQNVRIADEAIAEITLALESDPDDPRLARMLWSLYDHKLDLLRRAAATATET